jgi:hypothetical protein
MSRRASLRLEPRKGPTVSHRLLRRVSVSAVVLHAFLGLALLSGGCGGGGTGAVMTDENKQNIADELKATEDAKKNTEQKAKVEPGA